MRYWVMMEDVQRFKMRKSIVVIGIIFCCLIILWGGLLYNSISQLKEVVTINNYPIMAHYILGVILLGITLSWTIFLKIQQYIFSSISRIILLALFYIFTWMGSVIFFTTLLQNITASLS